MKSGILAAGILPAGFAWAADEGNDRAAIEKTVGAMAPLTADFDGRVELAQLATVTDKPRVAIVDASSTKAPLLMVLKKEGTDWKIASLRMLAP